MQKLSKTRKYFYIAFISALTSTTISATYWQYNRYHQSKQRWGIIKQQLSKDQPQDLITLIQKQQQEKKQFAQQGKYIYPYRYVKFKGIQLSNHQSSYRVRRSKNERVGEILYRPIILSDQSIIIAQQGWVPQGYQFKNQGKNVKQQKCREFIGLIRQNEKPGTYDKKQQGVNLHANISQIVSYFIKVDKIKIKDQQKKCFQRSIALPNHYIQILKPLHKNSQESEQSEEQIYPYKYSVDNFELPYLTPDKHKAYMTFWGLTTCVGLYSIFKVILM